MVKKPAVVKMLTSPFFVSHNDPNMTFWWSLQTLPPAVGGALADVGSTYWLKGGHKFCSYAF